MEVLKNKSKNKLFLTAFLALFFFCIYWGISSLVSIKEASRGEVSSPETSFEERKIVLEKKEDPKKLSSNPHLYTLTSPQKGITFAIAAEDNLLLQTLSGWNFSLQDTNPVWDPTLCAQMKSAILPGGEVFMIDARYIPGEKGGRLGLVNYFLLYKDGAHYEVKIDKENFRERVLSLAQDKEGNPIIIFSQKNKVFSYLLSFNDGIVKKTVISFGENFQKISLSQSQNLFYLEVEKGGEKKFFRFDGSSLQNVLYSEFLDKIEVSPSAAGLTLKSSDKSIKIPTEESYGIKILGEEGGVAYIEIFDRLNPFYFKLVQVDFMSQSFVVLAETEKNSKAKHVTIGFSPAK